MALLTVPQSARQKIQKSITCIKGLKKNSQKTTVIKKKYPANRNLSYERTLFTG